MKLIERRCWWCNNRLAAVGHKKVKTHCGIVIVHKSCMDYVYEWMHPITAQPRGENHSSKIYF